MVGFNFNFNKIKKDNVLNNILQSDTFDFKPTLTPGLNKFKNSNIVKKPILYLHKGNAPNKQFVKQVYSKIPDDEKVPVVFETKEQYLKEYIKNQEKNKSVKFTQQEKQQYIRSELQRMRPIQSRFTTYHNPYIEPRVVFFTDKPVSKREFQYNAQHEFGHELMERRPGLQRTWDDKTSLNNSPTSYGKTDEQEDFAESYALFKENKLKEEK